MKRRFAVILILIPLLAFGGCAKNPDTGKYEVDYEQLADVAQQTARYFSFEGLKYLHEKAPNQVTPAYNSFAALVEIVQRYSDGTIEIGEVAQTAVGIFQQIKNYFPATDTTITNLVAGWVSVLSGTLNLVLTAVPEKVALVLTGIALGFQGGLEDYTAWISAQQPTAGVMP